jgi:hypothetical protein
VIAITIAVAVAFVSGFCVCGWLTRDSKMRRENRILRHRVSRLEKTISESEDELSTVTELARLYENHFGKDLL